MAAADASSSRLVQSEDLVPGARIFYKSKDNGLMEGTVLEPLEEGANKVKVDVPGHCRGMTCLSKIYIAPQPMAEQLTVTAKSVDGEDGESCNLESDGCSMFVAGVVAWLHSLTTEGKANKKHWPRCLLQHCLLVVTKMS